MKTYDLIPDIHGQAEKFTSVLTNLGYFYRNGTWRHSDTDRTCIFLGDYIDRGHGNRSVLTTVRSMVDSGVALAIMGNHELNAIHYHSTHPNSGLPLRPRSPKNQGQHESFLDEFPLGGIETLDQINWMKTLPLFLELEEFRVVHACWNSKSIRFLKENTQNGVLSNDQFILAAEPKNDIKHNVDTVAKGPEVKLPDGHKFIDKGGSQRDEVRIKWWNSTAKTWADLSMSVPNPENLPSSSPPSDLLETVYPADAKPVFFGHYWLTGSPYLQAENVLCLDYSAGKDGPLVTYRFEVGDKRLNLSNISSSDFS
jgi:hypothetical protein